jgi:hypothetical protein
MTKSEMVGIFKKTEMPSEKIDSITVGRTYQGQFILSSYFSDGGNSIDESRYTILIYDDNKEWTSYDKEYFEPTD